jgi:endonuclease/exonuclease/phosphatase (EEP) superfamily protein YafD
MNQQPHPVAVLPRLTIIAGRLAVLLLILVGTALLVGEAGRWHWFADLFAHFRWQGLAGLATAALLAGVGRRPWVAGIALAACMLVGWSALPSRPPGDPQPDAVLRVVSVNVHVANSNAAPLLAWLNTVAADVIVVQELSPAMAAGLVDLQRQYPVHRLLPRADPFGIGIWSRLPDSQIEELALAGWSSTRPALKLRLTVAGQPLDLYAIHPPPPLNAALAKVQSDQFAQLRLLIAAGATPAALVGDFNATPWGEQFRRLRAIGLNHQGHAHWPPSWRPPLPWLALAIPIDHALVQAPWQLRRRECGPPIGSDHCPLLLELHAPAVRGALAHASHPPRYASISDTPPLRSR